MKALSNRETVLAQLSAALSAVNTEETEHLERMIIDAREVFCFGLGRSGLACRSFAMRLMHLGIPCSLVGDTLCHPIGEGDLLILISASGGSKALLEAALKAKHLHASVLLITANKDSAISKVVDACVLIHAPSKDDSLQETVSVLPMGSLFEEAAFVFCDMVVADLMQKLEITNEQMVKRHANLE